MKKLFALSLLTLAIGCAGSTTGPSYARDTSQQLNADRRYPHASNGEIILGPSTIDEVVTGQKDIVGNVHTDPLPQPQGAPNY